VTLGYRWASERGYLTDTAGEIWRSIKNINAGDLWSLGKEALLQLIPGYGLYRDLKYAYELVSTAVTLGEAVAAAGKAKSVLDAEHAAAELGDASKEGTEQLAEFTKGVIVQKAAGVGTDVTRAGLQRLAPRGETSAAPGSSGESGAGAPPGSPPPLPATPTHLGEPPPAGSEVPAGTKTSDLPAEAKTSDVPAEVKTSDPHVTAPISESHGKAQTSESDVEPRKPDPHATSAASETDPGPAGAGPAKPEAGHSPAGAPKPGEPTGQPPTLPPRPLPASLAGIRGRLAVVRDELTRIDGKQKGIGDRLDKLHAQREQWFERRPEAKQFAGQAEIGRLEHEFEKLREQEAKLQEEKGALDDAAGELTGVKGGEVQWQKYGYEDLGKRPPCFAAGTTVHTPEGPCPIELVREGAIVLARDPEWGIVPAKVTAVHVGWTRRFVELDVAGEKLLATPGHPFRRQDGDSWVAAGEIRTGDILDTLSGVPLTVSSTRPIQQVDTTYNLEVAEAHTFFVGRGGALVHNGPEAVIDTSKFANPKKTLTKIYVVVDTRESPPKVIYVGQTIQGGTDDVVKRFEGHLRTKSAWNAIKDHLRPELIHSGQWTPYEAACWEQHFIDQYGGARSVNPSTPLVNEVRAIDEDSFRRYHTALQNPCA
jgi:hypothetical protein